MCKVAKTKRGFVVISRHVVTSLKLGWDLLGHARIKPSPIKSQPKIDKSNVFATNWLADADAGNFRQTYL